ncbi:MAG: AAA family ATPase [Methyloprofundus sp.]|nr:AAA family ATPase [Methyloprofundus sp.]
MDSEEIFINRIKINEVRNIKDLDIPLSATERKHLIFTGKNGSGKTSVLLALQMFLVQVMHNAHKSYEEYTFHLNALQEQLNIESNQLRAAQLKGKIDAYKNQLSIFGGIEINFKNATNISLESKQGNFLIAYFDAKRTASLSTPNGITKVTLKKQYSPTDKANTAFIQYIVNLKAERSFARDDGDMEEVERIDQWFTQLENRLQDIFEAPSLKLVFDRKNYNFLIEIDGKLPFSLTELSDGHSAILSIISELILRMDAIERGNYHLQGIVLIDEIEAHIHVNLQKKILPFLTDFFPHLQFIITTHSPFVLSSISNSVICDLQHEIVTTDLSGYSYDALIESYFGSDKYSQVLKDKLARYESLSGDIKNIG